MILKLQKIINVLIIPCFIFLLACSGSNDKNPEEAGSSVLKINLIDNVKNITDAFNLSDISGSIELVQLEMIPDFLFNEDNINNLIVTDEFISFYSHQAGLLKYSREGKFLGRIGDIGRGPGEYQLLRNYFYDEAETTFAGYTNWTHELQFYNREGRFLRSLKPIYRGKSVDQIPGKIGNYYFIQSIHNFGEVTDTSQIYHFGFADSTFNEIKTLIDPGLSGHKEEIIQTRYQPNDSWANFFSPLPPVVKLYNDHVDFLYSNHDTIFRVDPDLNVTPLYSLVRGDKVPFSVLNFRIKPHEFFNYLLVSDFIETPGFVFLDFGFGRGRYKARFDKEDGKVEVLRNEVKIDDIIISGNLYGRRRDGRQPSFTNDLTGSGDFIPRWVNDKQWISLYSAFGLLDRIDIDSLSAVPVKHPESRHQLVEILKSAKETDGPVLMIVNLKY
jgi:hypothetical protein